MSYLEEIVAHHRSIAGGEARPTEELSAALEVAPPPRPFEARLRAPGMSVIAEIKRRSPSKGELAPDIDPRAVARDYEAGGAECISILTDERYFGGSADDLVVARAAASIPILRKDFTVDVGDVLESRVMGADAVLLIVAALSPGELDEYGSLARSLGMATLVEVHDEDELERALVSGATLVGVNQRDLRTFAVDPERAIRVGRAIPSGVTRIAESGIRDGDDVARLADAGFDGVLVGETLMRAPDRAAAIRELLAGVTSSDDPYGPKHSREGVAKCS